CRSRSWGRTFQGEVEGRAAAQAGLDPDAPAVSLDDLLADRQPDAVPRVLVPGVQPLEDDEQPVEEGGIDPDAVVADADPPLLFDALGRHVDPRRLGT